MTSVPTARILLDSDPQVAELLSQGWTVASESWGARLRVTGDVLATCREAVEMATAAGWQIRELDDADAEAVVALNTAHLEDYPWTIATAGSGRSARESLEVLRAGMADGTRWAFGALDTNGALLSATVLYVARAGTDSELVETDLTVTARAARGNGLAAAVKAAAVLSLAARKYTFFGTGGAGANEPSRRMNQAVGYVITERWLHLMPDAS